MSNIDARPPEGDSDSPELAREHALTLWRALLPTWTQPAARFRDPAALVAALEDPAAGRLVAERLMARHSAVSPSGVSRG